MLEVVRIRCTSYNGLSKSIKLRIGLVTPSQEFVVLHFV